MLLGVAHSPAVLEYYLRERCKIKAEFDAQAAALDAHMTAVQALRPVARAERIVRLCKDRTDRHREDGCLLCVYACLRAYMCVCMYVCGMSCVCIHARVRVCVSLSFSIYITVLVCVCVTMWL